MASQTTLGKAFEYACIQEIYNLLKETQHVEILRTSSFNIAKGFYKNADSSLQQKMSLGARAAVKVILRLEPQLQNASSNVPLYLSLQEDSKGKAGDVRDVLCIRRQNEWEIGLSCKHNHSAVKHSRLSQTIDFGELWFEIPCSNEYFQVITPLFDELRELKKQKMLWRDVLDKEERFYIPLLKAFMEELKGLDTTNPGIIPKRLLSYLLGRNDFYKVITIDSKELTKVQAYNIYGDLNRHAESVRPQTRIQQLKLPTKFFDIGFKDNSNNTINITCDGGWAVSMRIHNASSKVEPSLKFDVELIGVPPTLYTHFEPWE
jgi:hypothetical protein